MSERLYQNLISATEVNDDDFAELFAHDVAATIRALGRGAESRPFPVVLDWSTTRIVVRPSDFPGTESRLRVEVSAACR